MISQEFCKRVLLYTGTIAVMIAAAYFAIKYVLVLFLPFIIALSIAFASRPFRNYIMEKTHMTKKASAVTAVTVILGVTVYVFFHLFSRMAGELASIYSYLTERTDVAGVLYDAISGVISGLSDLLPFLNLEGLSPGEKMTSLISQLVPDLTSYIGQALTVTAKAVPYALIFTLMTVVSSFYFCVDLDRITAFLSGTFSGKAANFMSAAKSRLASAVYRYVRAYCFIMLMTFTELYIGFVFLRLPYAFSLAIIISVVDVLPILGTGTVLIPWSVAAFAMGDAFVGTGVMVLYILVTVIRQFCEPKIVGKSIGLYPPLTLIGMYVGIRLFGVTGLFVLPLVILGVKSVTELVTAKEKGKVKTE